MRMLFHVDQLSERGTSTAIFEYAKLSKSMNIEVLIAFPSDSDQTGRGIFEDEFELKPYRNFNNLKRDAKNFDFAYFLKYGNNDGKIIPGSLNLVQAVFPVYKPHGTKYFYVSKWLSEFMRSKHKNSMYSKLAKLRGTVNSKKFDYLPHCVDMPYSSFNPRESFGIPEDAVVGIRYGGFTTFDIPWIKKWIKFELENNNNFWFIAMNTEKFFAHERLLYLPTNMNKQDKANLIEAADFFLHARTQGETFGMSIVESLQVKTPVFAWRGGEDQNHLSLIKKQFLYDKDSDLSKLLIKKKSCYNYPEIFQISEDFRPKNIKPKFQKLLFEQ